MRIVRKWLGGFLFLMASGAAQAQVANAVFTSNLYVDVTGSGTFPYYACGGPFGGLTNCMGEGSLSAGGFPTEPYYGAQASASGASSPTVSVSASASSRGYGVANSFSDVVYEFEFLGPDQLSIPVSISLALQGQSTVDPTDPYAFADSEAHYRLSQAGADIDVIDLRCDAGLGQGCQSATENTTQSYDLLPNTVYDVELKAFTETWDSAVQGGAGSPYGETTPMASASADPHIFLDPTFSDAGDYQLVLSAGISNFIPQTTQSVPEPETWALMLIGLAGLATAARLRHRGAL